MTQSELQLSCSGVLVIKKPRSISLRSPPRQRGIIFFSLQSLVECTYSLEMGPLRQLSSSCTTLTTRTRFATPRDTAIHSSGKDVKGGRKVYSRSTSSKKKHWHSISSRGALSSKESKNEVGTREWTFITTLGRAAKGENSC